MTEPDGAGGAATDATQDAGGKSPTAASISGDDSAGGRPPRARGRRFPRWGRITLIVVLVLVLGGAGWLFLKTTQVSSKVFGGGGGVGGLLSGGDPLQTDPHGRVNVLIFGTSQDDVGHSSGEGAQGMWLTDSMQLMSVNPKKHTAQLIAIPRDTWVKQDQKCEVGELTKINAVFECAAAGEPDQPGYLPSFFTSVQTKVPHYQQRERAGARALMKEVGAVTGLQPQYYVHVNYSVLRDTVDAVGGIKVDVVGDGHDGLFDTNLDHGDCANEDKKCRHVYYPHDGSYELDGVHALDLARARADGYSPTNPHACMQFGLERGDFDRQANQQKIIDAMKVKAVSAGTLANPVKVDHLLNALGDNVRTDLSAGEAKTAINLVRQLGPLKSIDLLDPKHPVLTEGMESSQSVVEPAAGTFAYGSVHRYIQSQIELIENPPKPSSGSSPTSPSSPSSGSSSASPSAKSTYEPPITCSND